MGNNFQRGIIDLSIPDKHGTKFGVIIITRDSQSSKGNPIEKIADTLKGIIGPCIEKEIDGHDENDPLVTNIFAHESIECIFHEWFAQFFHKKKAPIHLKEEHHVTYERKRGLRRNNRILEKVIKSIFAKGKAQDTFVEIEKETKDRRGGCTPWSQEGIQRMKEKG